ncbi:MAG: methyltransferase [Nanoarchaeota archaeon]|nr:methyltransferase [Nanoarchaeota archaeon]
MNSKLVFFSNFLKRPKEVAAITPSSRYVIRHITKNIDFNNAKYIVEYGPGIGNITEELLKNMGPDARLVCIESNKKFCKFLDDNIQDRRLTVINDSAEKLESYIEKLNINNIDYVLSGIPFSLIKKEIKKDIIKKTEYVLREHGKFIIYQQYNGHLKKYLDIYFKKISTEVELRNIPPTMLYVCEKI